MILCEKTQTRSRSLKIRHSDKMIVKRLLQILNKEVDTVENGASNKGGLSKNDLAILTTVVAESFKKFNPKFTATSKLMREKLAVLKRFDQAINNGVLATPAEDAALENERAALSASKIAHQLDHSMSLVNEIILRQRRMNSRLEHLEMIEKYLSGL
uniref:Uncharacterized protein n=1 Tax=Romanomermis culicivorax TaxID=13658 RepID=A0A915IQF1_ROMCU